MMDRTTQQAAPVPGIQVISFHQEEFKRVRRAGGQVRPGGVFELTHRTIP